MTWQPDPKGIEEVVAALGTSAIGNTELQARTQKQIEHYVNTMPDFLNYFAYVLTYHTAAPDEVRQAAGLVLKSYLVRHWTQLHPSVKAYIQHTVLQAVGDPSRFVRTAAGILLTSIMEDTGIVGWPELIPTLTQLLDHPQRAVALGALVSLQKICEDHYEQLDADQTIRPLNVLIPKFITMMRLPDPEMRKGALHCIVQCISVMPHALVVHMSDFLQALFALTGDPDPEIRKRVCQAITAIVDTKFEHVAPYITSVMDFMLAQTQDRENDDVAVEACDFWHTVAEVPAAHDALRALLPRLLPVLLDAIVYEEDDFELLDILAADETVGDRASDIAPQFHDARTAGQDDGDDSGEYTDDDDDEDDDSETPVEAWTLRKYASAGLDSISAALKEALLPVLLPLLSARLAHPTDWKVREAAVVALGAIASGCGPVLAGSIDQIAGFLLPLLRDAQPAVRVNALWTLSRYAEWMFEKNQGGRFIGPILTEVMQRCLDVNKKVQESGISAFARIVDTAQDQLIPFLEPILQNLVFAFNKYQAKNLLILYDAVGSLADAVGRALNTPRMMELLLPPLIQRWGAVSNEDEALVPLLECLSSVVRALGIGFLPFVDGVMVRCFQISESTLLQILADPQGQHKTDFLTCALDLINAVIEACGEAVRGPLQQTRILDYLAQCAQVNDPKMEIKQTSFALMGDLARLSIELVQPALPVFVPLLAANLDVRYTQMCSNASWALGEIVLRAAPETVAPHVPDIVSRLLAALARPDLKYKNLKFNLCLTIARFGMVFPQMVAPHLPSFITRWCNIMRNMKDDHEKENAFRGMCLLLRHNPHAIVPAFVDFCDAVCSWQNPPQELYAMFREILHTFKGAMQPAQWQAYFAAFPTALAQSLSSRYGL